MRRFYCLQSLPPVGVDWGSRWGKIIHIRRAGRKFRLVRALRFYWNSQQKSPQLKAIWQTFDLRKKTVFLALDSHLSIVSSSDHIGLPHNFFRFQPQQQSAPDLTKQYNDSLTLQDTNGKQRNLHVTASREQIETIKQQVEQAGLRAEVIDNKVLALCNAYVFSYADKRNQPVYLLHLGHQSSHLVFYQAALPVWTQQLDLSGKVLIDTLCLLLKTDPITAENMLRNEMEGKKDNQACQQIISSFLTAQSAQLAALIREKKYMVKTIYVSGGLALIPKIFQHLQATLDYDIQKFNCWRNLYIDEKNFDMQYLKSTAAHFAVACGMALRSAIPKNKKGLA